MICELDKLAATNYVDDDSYEHAEMVRRESIEAVKMIEECFASKERRVQAMTGEGTVLDSIQFRNEAKRNVNLFFLSMISEIFFFISFRNPTMTPSWVVA